MPRAVQVSGSGVCPVGLRSLGLLVRSISVSSRIVGPHELDQAYRFAVCSPFPYPLASKTCSEATHYLLSVFISQSNIFKLSHSASIPRNHQQPTLKIMLCLGDLRVDSWSLQGELSPKESWKSRDPLQPWPDPQDSLWFEAV